MSTFVTYFKTVQQVYKAKIAKCWQSLNLDTRIRMLFGISFYFSEYCYVSVCIIHACKQEN